jgi:uncharacterized protein YjbI with pentapeptide repeats
MANPEHLAKLKQGVETWNNWRRDSFVIPDLSEAFLGGRNLVGVNLSEADLSNANFLSSDLSFADLGAADFSGVQLSLANVSGPI